MTTTVHLALSVQRLLATTVRDWGLPCAAKAAGGMALQGMAAGQATSRPSELSLAARRIGDQRGPADHQRERMFLSQWPYWPAYPGLAAEWR